MKPEWREKLVEVARRSVAKLGKSVVAWKPLGAEEQQSKEARESRPAADPDELPQDAQIALMRILSFPEETLAERWTALGWNRHLELRAREQLTTRGLVQEAGRIGRQVLFAWTEKGRAWAEKRGMDVRSFKSGMLHEIILRRTARGILQADASGRFRRSKATQQRQPDGLLLFPNGLRIVIQVSVTNTPEYEASALHDLARDPHVDAILMICAERGKGEKIQKALEGLRGEDGEIQEEDAKVFFLEAAAACVPGFDWVPVLERIRGRTAG